MSTVALPEIRVLASAGAALPIVLDEIRRVAGSPKPLVGICTGRTFDRAWKTLSEQMLSGRMSSDFVLTHPGEYLGFGPDRAGGKVHELITNCPPLAAMLEAGTFLPVPCEPDARAIVEHEARIMRNGGLELLFLGLGPRGQLALNEPGAAFERGFHVTALSAESRERGRPRFAPGEPPRQAVTAGIANILAARRLVLCAFGEEKALAVQQMLAGPIGSACPATAIRRHPNALVLLDPAAAARLEQPVVLEPAARIAAAGEAGAAAAPARDPSAAAKT